MASDSSMGHQIKKLQGSGNYDQWARDMEMYLLDLDVWIFVWGEVPEDATAAEKKLAGRAKAKIYLLLEEGPKIEVVGIDTAHKMWTKPQARQGLSIEGRE